MDDRGRKYYKTPGRQDSSVLRKVRGGGSLKHPDPCRESSEGINPPPPRTPLKDASARRFFTHSCALGPVCVCFRPRFESISAIRGGSGCQQVSCCTGSRSSPPRCNGRYLLLTRSPHTITELCGGNLCLYLHLLLILSSLSPSSIRQCVTVSLLSSTHPQCHTHSHTRGHLTQQFISIPNLWERMSSGVSTPCMAACINICTLIWPRLSSSIHPDIDWFSQQVSVSPIWLMGGVREGGVIEPGCPTCQCSVLHHWAKKPWAKAWRPRLHLIQMHGGRGGLISVYADQSVSG